MQDFAQVSALKYNKMIRVSLSLEFINVQLLRTLHRIVSKYHNFRYEKDSKLESKVLNLKRIAVL